MYVILFLHRVSVKPLNSVWQRRVRLPASSTRAFPEHRELHLLWGLETRHAAGGVQQGKCAAMERLWCGVSLLLFHPFITNLSWLYVMHSVWFLLRNEYLWVGSSDCNLEKQQKTLAVWLLFSGSCFKKYRSPPPKSVLGEQHHSVPVPWSCCECFLM